MLTLLAFRINTTTTQTILGSNGAIGTELAKSLTAYTNKIRSVSRPPYKVKEQGTLFAAGPSQRP